MLDSKITLFEKYQNIRTSYYQIPINAQRLFMSHFGKDNCMEFIDKHFEKGNKSGVFEINHDFSTDYERAGKHQHTVSLYLLGLSLCNLFDNPLKTKLSELITDMSWYNFKYSWYLTCLYHDVTSCIERSLSHTILVDKVAKSALFTHIPIKADAKLLRFPKNTIINYLNYRKKNNRIEHGIVGGTLLFDKLKKSFDSKTRNHDWSLSKEYRKGHLRWRREHLDHFAYIADAVCCHNIWLVPKENESKCNEYIEANLPELIVYNDYSKLSLSNYPLQFMLCLLDTIEPVKRFQGLSAETVLKNIYVTSDRETIVISWNSIIKQQTEFDAWINSVKALDEWMTVAITPCESNNDGCSLSIILKGIANN